MLRVFVVDDMPSARAGLSAFLSSLEDTEVVGTAADGAEAVERISTDPPHVAIMDIEMPRMDGLEAIRTLRARVIPVHIIAMSTGWEFREQALAAGADGFVYKGESLAELISLLELFRVVTLDREQPGPSEDSNPPITIIELETAYGLMNVNFE
jgi:DNA-binding NarL/FixJ family response regulator